MRQGTTWDVLLYCEAPVAGGVSSMVAALAGGVPRSIRLHVVHASTPQMTRWANTTLPVHVTSEPIALRNRLDLLGWFDLPRLWVLWRRIGRAQIIHVHAHTAFACLPLLALSVLRRHRRTVLTEHYIAQIPFLERRRRGLLVSTLRRGRIRSLLFLKRHLLSRVAHVVGVSAANARLLQETVRPTLRHPVTVIPNGIDPAPFPELGIVQGDMPHDIDLPSDTQHIVCTVAGLNSQKGHEYLLRAVPEILSVFPGTTFLLVGDGHLLHSLSRLVQDLDIAGKVVFAGRRDDVPSILAASDLFVLPSLFEGMPMSVLEAMAAGLPVVATAVDGTAEAVLDGQTGILVRSASSTELTSGVISMLRDASRMEQLGRNGRRRFLDLFTASAMAGSYLNIYAKLGVGSPAPDSRLHHSS